MKNLGCIGCHQLGQKSTRTIPDAFGTFASASRRGCGACSRARRASRCSAQLNEPRRRIVPAPGRVDRSRRQGRAAARTPPRPQGVERNIVVTLRDWMSERKYLHDLIASDRRNPTVNANGPLYGSPEYSSDLMPILDPVAEHGDDVPAAGARCGHAAEPRAGPRGGARRRCSRRRTGAARRIWDTRANNHNSMFDRDGPAVARGGGARRRRIRRSAARVRTIRRRSCSRPSARTGIWPSSIRRRRSTRSSTRASARITCSSATTRTTRCGRAAAGQVLGWLNSEDVPRDGRCRAGRRAGRRSCSTRTATAGATSTSSRTSPSIRRRTSASPAASTP